MAESVEERISGAKLLNRDRTILDYILKNKKHAGCPVVAMTDSYAVPIALGAERVILSNSNNLSFFDSFVSLTMNMEKIILIVTKRDRVTSEARLAKMEHYLKKTGQY